MTRSPSPCVLELSYQLPSGYRWRKIALHHRWLARASISEYMVDGANVDGREPRRFTATISEWGGWYLGTYAPAPDVAERVIAVASEIQERIERNDEGVFEDQRYNIRRHRR